MPTCKPCFLQLQDSFWMDNIQTIYSYLYHDSIPNVFTLNSNNLTIHSGARTGVSRSDVAHEACLRNESTGNNTDCLDSKKHFSSFHFKTLYNPHHSLSYTIREKSGSCTRHIRRKPTFSEGKELAHLLPGFAQSVQLPFLPQEFDQVYMAIVVKHVD